MTTVVVSAGTYHLPFHRLTDWVSAWYADHEEIDLIVQHGPSHPVAGATNHELLAYSDLLSLCKSADVVVLQGGAGGVMDMQRLGIVPIVVPRVPVNDEVVDDHQLVFTAEMQRLGAIHRATTREELARLLDAAVSGDLQVRDATVVQTPGIQRFQDLAMPPTPISLLTTLRRGAQIVRTVLAKRLRSR